MTEQHANQTLHTKLRKSLGLTGDDKINADDSSDKASDKALVVPAWVGQLNETQQQDLAALIEQRLDQEGSGLYSAMAVGSGLVPGKLKAKIAQNNLGPRGTAKMTDFMPIKKALGVAKYLPDEFLAEVMVHIAPQRAVEILDEASDEMLFSVVQILVEKGRYEEIAAVCDHLDVGVLVLIARALNNPYATVRISNMMMERKRVATTVSQLDDEFLVSLLNEAHLAGFQQHAAEVAQQQPIERQVMLLKSLPVAHAAALAQHYDADVIAKLVPVMEDELAVEIGMQMDGESLGRSINQLEAEDINNVVPYLGNERMAETLPHVNLKRLENKWPQLSSSVQDMFGRLSKYYQPLAHIIRKLRR